MKGGRILGQGYKSVVYDVCLSDMNVYNTQQFCKKELQDSDAITLYVYDFDKRRIVQKCVSVELFRVIMQQRGYVVKQFLDNSSLTRKIIASQSFQNEMKGFESVLTIMQTLENALNYTVIGMLAHITNASANAEPNSCFNAYNSATSQSKLVLGFRIMNGKETRYYALNKACTMGTLTERLAEREMDAREFEMLVRDILEVVVLLQKNNMAHGDIKLDNILVCTNGARQKYILIDWEYSRMLTLDFIKGKETGINYKGSAPIYFRIHFPVGTKVSYEIAARNYMKETGGTAEFINQGYHEMKKLLKKGSLEDVFEETKYTLDLHALGLILSGIIARNPSLQRYALFTHHLATYTFDNAEAALHYFLQDPSQNISMM